jgi:flagellar basal-body rod modification protein FlgD
MIPSIQTINAEAQKAAVTSTNSSGSTASTGSSTITANDFLTLLVTEMKNQDPTQPTDPNAYIQQLVQVNSLQQLIGINQGITSLDTAAGATTSTTSA